MCKLPVITVLWPQKLFECAVTGHKELNSVTKKKTASALSQIRQRCKNIVRIKTKTVNAHSHATPSHILTSWATPKEGMCATIIVKKWEHFFTLLTHTNIQVAVQKWLSSLEPYAKTHAWRLETHLRTPVFLLSASTASLIMFKLPVLTVLWPQTTKGVWECRYRP